jgi:hypothetical protein
MPMGRPRALARVSPDVVLGRALLFLPCTADGPTAREVVASAEWGSQRIRIPLS